MKVQLKYGMEGYGLYWYCIELIVDGINDSKLTFELEHDAEIIASQTGIHYERVQEMMTYMVELGLFERNNGTITCLKILKRLDKSMTSNKSFRGMINAAKEEVMMNPDKVMTKSGLVMQDKTRLDNTTQLKTLGHSVTSRFEDFWKVYPRKVKKADALKKWKLKKLDSKADMLIADVENRVVNDSQWRKSEFIPHPTTYLNGERWNDELTTVEVELTYAQQMAEDLKNG